MMIQTSKSFLFTICFFLAFFTFTSTINSQTEYYTKVSSSNGYDVEIVLTPVDIQAPSSCPWGYNFNVVIEYHVRFSGRNIPGSLYTLQGNMNCGNFLNNFFNLPNDGGVGTVVTVGNPWNSNTDCATATVESLLCNSFDLKIHGPGIPSQTVHMSIALPVELFQYEVKLKNNNVRIDWATQSETNCDYFEVERSRDGYHFEAIGKEFGAGNSESLRYYSATDRFPFEGKSYYRLKQVDFDGTTTYFDVKMVENNDGFTDQYGLSVFPNPIMEHEKFNIGLDGFAGNTVQINIVNMTGVLIYSDEFTINQERELIELSSDIIPGSGTYIVSILSNKRWYHYKFNYLL
jgi:hypothetical protein